MLGKFFTVPSFVLALFVQVYGHAAIAPALGVDGGTPNRGDVKSPSNNNPCGNNIDIAATIDSSQTVAIKDGSITVNSINFNGGGDGSRQVSAKLDSTGKGDAFNTDLTVTKNGDPAPNQEQGQDSVTVSIPADTKCTGGKDGNKCLVQFKTTAGFGNCVVVQQDAAAAAPPAAAAGNDNTNAAADPAGAGDATADAGAGDATANAGGNATADAGAAAKTDAKTDTGTAAGADTKAATGSGADANTGSGADTKTDAAADTGAGAKDAAGNADANTGTGAANATADNTAAAADDKANTNAAANTDAATGAGTADPSTAVGTAGGAAAGAGAATAAAAAGADANANGDGKKKAKKNKKNKKKGSRPAGTRAARAVRAGIDIRDYEAPEVLRRSWSWAKESN